jgi:hypothetical protein
MEAQIPAVGLLGSSRDELKVLRPADHTRQMAHPGWPYPVIGDRPTARGINFRQIYSASVLKNFLSSEQIPIVGSKAYGPD